MAKKKIEISIHSYGLYTPWHSKGKGIPKPIEFTTEIPITPDVEFGYVLSIKNGRREKNGGGNGVAFPGSDTDRS